MIIIFVVACWACYQALTSEAHAHHVGMMNVVSARIAKTIRGVEINAMNAFDEVEEKLNSPESVIAALESKTAINPEVRGYFAAFEPYYFQQEGQWFEPYVHHVDSSDFELRNVGSASHDYHKSPWYIRAKESKESFWAEPYYYYDGTSISGHYTTFVMPIYDKTGRLACVCGADMTFEWLGKELERIDEEIRQSYLINDNLHNLDDCYSVIINSDGSCFAHPDDKVVAMIKEQAGDTFKKNQTGTIEMNINGKASTVYYTPIDHVDWSAAIIVPHHTFMTPLIKFVIIFFLVAALGLLAIWLVCRRALKK